MENHGADNCEITLLPIYVIEKYGITQSLYYIVTLCRSCVIA